MAAVAWPVVPDSPVTLSGGLGETVLPEPPESASTALADAVGSGSAARDAISQVVAGHPAYLEAWAELGDRARDEIEAYACYRVGYHRGLDALRANGWRGSGYVRWNRPSNRAFLRCLEGLRSRAEAIGEQDEVDRLATFLRQLEPDWDRRSET